MCNIFGYLKLIDIFKYLEIPKILNISESDFREKINLKKSEEYSIL